MFPVKVESRSEWQQAVWICTSCESQSLLSAPQAPLTSVCLDKSCLCSCSCRQRSPIMDLSCRKSTVIPSADKINEGARAQQESKCPLSNIIRAFVVIYEAGKWSTTWISQSWGVDCVLAGGDWNRLSLARGGLDEMTEAEELRDHNPIYDFWTFEDYLSCRF